MASDALARSDAPESGSTPEYATVLEVVMVTAQRRAEPLQNVPISVTAINGDRIQEGEIMSVSDIAAVTPNFVFTQFNIGEPEYTVRGIGSTNDSAGSDPSVGMFIDDVYIGRTGGTSMDLYDLDRVEVLRGPQGTLFGKNVVGGAISMYTQKPTDEFESRWGLTIGNLDRFMFRGLINGAISDTVNGKFSFSVNQRDGYVENVIDGRDYMDEDNISLRGQLLFTPTDDLDMLVILDYSEDDQEGNCRNVNNLALNDPLGLAVFYPPVIAATTGGDLRKCALTAPAGQEREVGGALLKIDWDVRDMNFKSITAYRYADYQWFEDLAGLPQGTTPFNLIDLADEESNQFSQEFRLISTGESEIDWLLGAFYLDEDVDRAENFIGSFASPLAEQGFALLNGDVIFAQNANTTSHALFGKVDWHFAEDWTLSLSGRWAKDRKSVDQAMINQEDPAFDVGLLTFLDHPNPRVVLGIPANAPGDLFPYLITGSPDFLRTPYQIKAKDSWSQFLPSAYLNWQFSNTAMAYLTYSEGYKSGAFQSQTPTPEAAATPLEPENARNFEIGIKSEWFDRRLRFNASAFNIDYTDLQVFQLVGSLLVGGNAEATSRGVEMELTTLLTDTWIVGASYGYLDAEYDIYELGDDDLSGNKLPRAPENSFNLNSKYTWLLDSGAGVDLSVVYSWQDAFFLDPSNALSTLQPSYGELDARLSWRNDHWEATLWGRNLTDEIYRINTFISNIAGTVDLWGMPRTYGVTVTYRY